MKEESYELIVIEKFHFSDGRIVFVGRVNGSIKVIPPGYCDVQVRGQKKVTIWVHGEEFPETKQIDYRAVSTSEQMAIDSPFVSGEWKLVFRQ